MKRFLVIVGLSFMLTGCLGYGSRGNEMTGQVKKVTHHTPMICPEWTEADISMGVMRSGVGSMSIQDVELKVLNREDISMLEEASKSGRIVTVKYDEARLRLCCNEREITETNYEEVN